MEKNIFLVDIQPLPDALGFVETIEDVEPTSPMMTGQFRYHNFHHGLSMHATDAVEQQNSNNRLELLPGLSFNFIFKGQINYSFADQRYCLEPQDDQTICSAIINNRPEVMTRHMTAGMHIRKANIYVEYDWLYQRCDNPADKVRLEQLFTRQAVHCWQPAEQTLQQAMHLLMMKDYGNLAAKLKSEQMTIALLSRCLEELYIQVGEERPLAAPIDNTRCSLKHRIDQSLPHCRQLRDIASKLHMSERTLQRKFKARYQQTAASYVKSKRFELAKKALVIEKKSIGEVAYIAGYNHSSNFVNAFKREFGVTPTEFMKQHHYQAGK